MEVVTRHITDPPPRLSAGQQLPEQMVQLVASMMERDRERRPGYSEIRATLRALHPADGGALLGQFEAFERRRRAMVTQSGPVVRVLTGPALPDASPAEGGERATTAPTKALRARVAAGAQPANGSGGHDVAAGPSTLLSLPRKRGWMFVAVLVLIAGVGALAFALLGGGGSTREAPSGAVRPQPAAAPDSAAPGADLHAAAVDPLGASTCVRGASAGEGALMVAKAPLSRSAAVAALPDLEPVLARTPVARRVTHLEAELIAQHFRSRLPTAREWQRLLRQKVIAPLPGTCEWVARASSRARPRCMTAKRSFQLGERTRTRIRTTVVRLVQDGCGSQSRGRRKL